MRGSTIWGAVVLGGLVAAMSTAGCSCGDSNSTGTGGNGAGGNGAGGNAAGGHGNGDGDIMSATLIVDQLAFDAALSADGSVVYFTGTNAKGSAVFSVPASPGHTPDVVAQGGPLVAPFGIAVSTDGKTLFVADPGAESSKDDAGTIFSVSAEGGTPNALPGTAGAVPRSLEVVDEGGKDFVWFSGTLKGEIGVFKISSAGGSVTTVAKGGPFRDPAGVAAMSDGTAYVVDTTGGSYADATLLQIDKNGMVTTFLNHLDVGYPAGLTLVQDEKALLVSGLRNAYDHAAVLHVDLQSREITYFPGDGKKSDFTALFEPGGMHRGKKTDKYAWVVGDATGGGVFLLK